jgi:4-hydroxybenzoate polyprenyltransferase
MNELHIARKVRQALDIGTESIPERQLDRLYSARNKALRVQKQPALQFSMAWVGAVAGRATSLYTVGRTWLPLAALMIGLVTIVQMQNAEPTLSVAEAEEIDSAVLSSELPINAYLDRGFDAWLKRSSE